MAWILSNALILTDMFTRTDCLLSPKTNPNTSQMTEVVQSVALHRNRHKLEISQKLCDNILALSSVDCAKSYQNLT